MPSWWRECPRDVEKPSKVTEMMIVVVDEIDHHLQGGERGGQHEDPNQREGQPVETDQSQVFGLSKLCKCQGQRQKSDFSSFPSCDKFCHILGLRSITTQLAGLC